MHKLELFGRYRRLEAAIVTLAAMIGLSGLPAGASAAALPPGCTQSGQIVSCSVTFTSGSNPFTVPAVVPSMHVVAVGGMGGPSSLGASGGQGAVVSGEVAVSPGETLYAVVGADAGGQTVGGAGGGSGQDLGGDGGGASDLRTSQNDLSSRLLVAAGGGGGGGFGQVQIGGSVVYGRVAGPGGAGGGNNGSIGAGGGGAGGGGGSSSGGAGGALGSTCITIALPPPPPLTICGSGGSGSDGALGNGGSGGAGASLTEFSIEFSGSGGGGGGGGLFGGGGGGGGFGAGNGGGGGANLVPPGGSQSIDTTGVPMVQISYKLVPTTKTPCMNEGWQDFPQFKNQGDCVTFVETGK